MHLGLHPLLQQQLTLLDDLSVDVGAQIARDRINGLILLFDPDGEGRMNGVFPGENARCRPGSGPEAGTSIAIGREKPKHCRRWALRSAFLTHFAGFFATFAVQLFTAKIAKKCR
jgi:hypothetical protein